MTTGLSKSLRYMDSTLYMVIDASVGSQAMLRTVSGYILSAM